jgi:hypothetical protein
VAYNSNESGAVEVYVRPAASSADAGTWQVSSGGGTTPVWSRTARELYFSQAGQIMVSSQRLHQTAFSNFDLAPDGRQFAIVPEAPASARGRLAILQNFFDELRRHVP